MSLEKRVQQLEEQVADLQQQMAKLQQPSVDTERKKRKASDFLFQKEPVKREHSEQPAVVVEEQSVPAPQHVPPTALTRSLEERLFGRVSDGVRTALGHTTATNQLALPAPIASEVAKMRDELAILQVMNDPLGVYARLPFNLTIE